MRKKALIIGGKKEAADYIKIALGSDFPVRFADPAHRIKAKRQIELIFFPCDFQCSLADCFPRFMFAHLCRALWNIINTDKLIKTIALDLGYKPASFSERFKEHFGVAPSIKSREFGRHELTMGLSAPIVILRDGVEGNGEKVFSRSSFIDSSAVFAE